MYKIKPVSYVLMLNLIIIFNSFTQIFQEQIIQELEIDIQKKVKTKIDSIQKEKQKLTEEIKNFKKKGIRVTTNYNLALYASPSEISEIICRITPGSYFILKDFSDNWFRKINYNDKIGYVIGVFIAKNDTLDTLLNKISKLKFLERNEVELKNKIYIEEIQNYIKKLEGSKGWIRVLKANIRSYPSISAKVIRQLTQGDVVYLLDKKKNWYHILTKSENYYEPVYIEDLKDIYDEGWIHQNLISFKAIRKLTEDEIRRRKFVQSNMNIPKKFKDAILRGAIMLGMTKEMVVASWGYPNDINRTVGSWGVNEQWIYGTDIRFTKYLYFENGILVSWQD